MRPAAIVINSFLCPSDTVTQLPTGLILPGYGVAPVNYRANEGSGARVIFQSLGLALVGECPPTNETFVFATTTKPESSIYTFVGSDGDPEDPEEADAEGGGFDPGDEFFLTVNDDGDIDLVHFEYDALDGTIATGTLAVDNGGAVNDCLVTGDVIVG